MADPDDLIDPGLTPEERELLNRGLFGWMGASYLTDALAVAMGFANAADFDRQASRIADALADGIPLGGWDWKRTLLATEIAYASDVLGLGVEWETITALGDERTLSVLRGLQRKLVGVGPILAFGPHGERGEVTSRHLGIR